MTDVVICDTNAVIQLAIICPKCLESQQATLRLLVHSIVKSEIHNLRKDADKQARLGKIFDIILTKVPSTNNVKFPNRQREDRLHIMILGVERGLPAHMVTAGSSPNDRKLLMLAKENSAHLLTNEKTLFNLGVALIKDKETWRVGQAIKKVKELSIMTDVEIQAGIDELAKYQEVLSSECAKCVRDLGFKY